MLMPTRDLKISESILGLSGLLIKSLLKKSLTLDDLWIDYCKKYQKKDMIYHTFEDYMLAIDFLYMINKITIDKEGVIYFV